MKMFSIYVKAPAVWGGVQSTGSVAYNPRSKQWLSCDTPGIPHYGCAVGGQMAGTSGTVSYNVLQTLSGNSMTLGDGARAAQERHG